MTRPVFLPAFIRPDPASLDALPVRIYRNLLAAIRAGSISAGMKLPSSRKAAETLGVSRSTVNTAYDLLRAEGVLRMRPGTAAEIIVPKIVEAGKELLPERRISERGCLLSEDVRAGSYAVATGTMGPGVPDEALFPSDEWGRILRRVTRQRHGSLAAYENPFGISALREVVAERLYADRGVHVSPEQILITTGTQASLTLIAQVMTDPGDTAALEDPAHLGARTAFLGAGLKLAPVPVDEDGIVPAFIPDDARVVYVTPSNQYPLGSRLSFSRRMQILEQARRTGALILEDDYDSEFLWRGREIAAMAAYARGGEVIYLGSAAKTLLPALRIGWMAVPRPLVKPLRAALRNFGMMANLHTQLALAEMMRSGLYRAQLRRIAKTYEMRGNALFQALACRETVEVRQPDGGVQLAVRFRKSGFESRVMTELGQKGFRPARLSALCLAEKMEGLVMGFADATEESVNRFCSTLDEILC
ncbi:MocR-like pyridoxine biosynthesis transcription factor PdxR [Acetobacter conturbans]|nr:PLP-dependent aminotransferase family protein [Acetobacter conturbans]